MAAVADGVAERLARAEDGAAAHEPEAVIRKSFKSQTVLIELALPQAALLGFHFLLEKLLRCTSLRDFIKFALLGIGREQSPAPGRH